MKSFRAVGAVLLALQAVWCQSVTFHSPVISQNMKDTSRFGVIWETPRSAWMPKCQTKPNIDGRLDDDCWKGSARLTGFVSGGANAARPYRNTVRLCYDNDSFYLGCEFGEPHPEKITAGVKEHNLVQIWTDDCVELHIEVDGQDLHVPNYRGKPTWFQFITNTAAARFTQLACARRPGSHRYHPQLIHEQWQSSASTGKNAFTIEIAVPWKLLHITPIEGKSFRMNVGRNKPYNPESWNTNAYHRPDRFGTVFFGRKNQSGVEIRSAELNCAGKEWSVAVEAVAVNEPQMVTMATTLKQRDTVLQSIKSQPVTITSTPGAVAVSLPVKKPGDYDVQVEVFSEGKLVARGHAKGRQKPLIERFFLFRSDLNAGEEVVRGYFRLAALPRDSRLSATFELRDRRGLLAKSKPIPVRAAEAQFDFAVPPLAAGRPTFQLIIANDRGEVIGSFTRKLGVRQYSAAARERIHFHIDEPAGVARTNWPLTAGIPFGQGMMRVDDAAKRSRILDAAGKVLPCQTRVLATWTDARQFARWVLFDFQGDLAAGKGGDFFVEFGSDVSRSAPEDDLVDEPLDGGLVVDTGPLRMSLDDELPIFFGSVSVNGKQVTRRNGEGELYLKLGDPSLNAKLLPRQYEYKLDRSTRTFLAELSTKDYRLEVETAGPIRSVIKATGWYATQDGSRLFKYLLRLYVYRGHSMIHGFHTFISTEAEQYVDSMGLRVQCIGRLQKTTFGTGPRSTFTALMPNSAEQVALIQPSSEYFRILEYPRGDSSPWGAQLASGRRAAGWCDAALGNTNVLLGAKNLWQEFPKELSVNSDGSFELGFVGMRSPAHLDLRSLPFGKEEQAVGSSQGVAKTTRFVLDFHAPDASTEATASRARAALSDLAVWIDPEWVQRADPFWAPVARCTPESDDPLKRAYANHVRMYSPNQEQRPEVVHGLPIYGILNYGDRVHGMATRGWFNNEDYFLPYQEWIAFLATGQRGMFDAVTAFTRHLIDIDTLNYTTRTPGRLGLQSRHRRLHWGQPSAITHSYLDQSLLYYYLTGYERGADHAELIRSGQSIWDWWPAEGWYSKENTSGAVSRDFGVNLRILMNAYRHCWDPVLLVRAHELWERYAIGFTPEGYHRAGYFNVRRPAELYTRYTADPPAVEAVLRSDELCPTLSEELGQPQKLETWLGQAHRALSNAHKIIDVPPWAIQFGAESSGLDSVLALGAREKAKRDGREVEPGVEGVLKFSGTWDIVFLEDHDREHDVEVKINKGGDATDAAATLFDPAGKVVFTKPFNTKDLPIMTHGVILKLKIPQDGVTGHYLLRLERLSGAYMRCWLSKGPKKRVYLIDPKSFNLGSFYGGRFWFYVPKGTNGFRIGARPSNRAARFGFAVYDGGNRIVDSKAWYFHWRRETPNTHWLDIKAPENAQGAWWSIPYTCRKDIIFSWPKELPPYLSDSPSAGFIPDEGYLKRMQSNKGEK